LGTNADQVHTTTLDIKMFTIINVAISLLAIASGFIVVFVLISAKRLDGWTAFFLATMILTSMTGFGFPIVGVTPGIVLVVISLSELPFVITQLVALAACIGLGFLATTGFRERTVNAA
jgi:hypothetical protein